MDFNLSQEERDNQRQKRLQKPVEKDELMKRKENVSYGLRKNNRESLLNMKRGIHDENSQVEKQAGNVYFNEISLVIFINLKIESIMLTIKSSSSKEDIFKSIDELRKLVCSGKYVYTATILKMDGISILVNFLNLYFQSPSLIPLEYVYYTILILSNMAA
jgi:hypothetical protein